MAEMMAEAWVEVMVVPWAGRTVEMKAGMWVAL